MTNHDIISATPYCIVLTTTASEAQAQAQAQAQTLAWLTS